MQNPVDNDIDRMVSNAANAGMVVAGGFLMEAVRLRTPEGKEQTRQEEIRKCLALCVKMEYSHNKYVDGMQ